MAMIHNRTRFDDKDPVMQATDKWPKGLLDPRELKPKAERVIPAVRLPMSEVLKMMGLKQ